MILMRIGIAALLVLVLFGPGIARAADTGTISGKVVFVGDPPQPTRIEIKQDTNKCGTEKVLENLVLGSNQGVHWAVVDLVGAEGTAGREAPGSKLDQNGCRFLPHVLVVPPGADLTVLNSDGILHNVHTHPGKNRPVNRAQPGFKKEMTMSFGEADIVKVVCDVHPWMTAWIIVSDNPYIAVTDDKGTFELSGINPGNYKLKLWHEVLGEQVKEITVRAGEETQVTFETTMK